MSGLIYSLHSSVQSLTAQSRGIETAGKNLANVNNPSYARQRVILGDRGTVVTPTGAQSMGLEAMGINQLRDALTDRQVGREIALKSTFEAEQRGYERAQAGLGQTIDRSRSAGSATTDANSGIGAALDNLFNAFQSVSARPTDDSERQVLLQKAALLVERFGSVDQHLAQVQDDLSDQVQEDITESNALLHIIADLNAQIARVEFSAAGSAPDLRDQRQARIEELATKISFEAREVSGSTRITVTDGSGGDIVLVDGPSVPGDLTFNGTQVSGGSPAAVVALSAGAIKGSLAARDGAVLTLRTDLDRLAAQLVSSVNAAYNPSGTTGNFFTGTTAGTIDLVGGLTAANLTTGSTGAAGDNSVARAVAELASARFSSAAGDVIDGTFSGFFSRTVSQLGQAVAGADARVEDQSNIERLVRSQRDAISSVSLDEEMGDLMKYQRAFQASSRVFTIVDDLLETVVTQLGRS